MRACHLLVHVCVCVCVSDWKRITDTKTTCQPWVAVSGQPCHTAPGVLLLRSFVPGPAPRQLHTTTHHGPCALPAVPPERGAMWDTSQSAGWCLPPAPALLPPRGSWSPPLPLFSLLSSLPLSMCLKNTPILSSLSFRLVFSLSFTLYPFFSLSAPSTSLPQLANDSLSLPLVWLCLSLCLFIFHSFFHSVSLSLPVSVFLPDRSEGHKLLSSRPQESSKTSPAREQRSEPPTTHTHTHTLHRSVYRKVKDSNEREDGNSIWNLL